MREITDGAAVVVRGDEAGGAGLSMTVDLLEPIGPRTIIHLRAGSVEMLAVEDKRFGGRHASRVTAVLPAAQCHLFDAESGWALGRAERRGREAA